MQIWIKVARYLEVPNWFATLDKLYLMSIQDFGPRQLWKRWLRLFYILNKQYNLKTPCASWRTQHYLHTKMYIKLALMGFIYYNNKLINTHFLDINNKLYKYKYNMKSSTHKMKKKNEISRLIYNLSSNQAKWKPLWSDLTYFLKLNKLIYI